MMHAANGRGSAIIAVRIIAVFLGVMLSAALLPAVAFAATPAFQAGTSTTDIQGERVSTQSTLTTCASAKKVKAAKKAYKRYLKAHPSFKYFRVVKMGNGGVPVLLCTDRDPFVYAGKTYFNSVDVIIYNKAKSAKVKNIGSATTASSGFALDYSKSALCGYRVCGLHTFGVATVKNGHLSMSGMFENGWLPNLELRHFKNYNPKTKIPLENSKALGKKGTEKQYRNLKKKYGYGTNGLGKSLLKLYKNNASNRAKRI